MWGIQAVHSLWESSQHHHPPLPELVEKLSSMKLAPGAKKVGDCWSRVQTVCYNTFLKSLLCPNIIYILENNICKFHVCFWTVLSVKPISEHKRLYLAELRHIGVYKTHTPEITTSYLDSSGCNITKLCFAILLLIPCGLFNIRKQLTSPKCLSILAQKHQAVHAKAKFQILRSRLIQ